MIINQDFYWCNKCAEMYAFDTSKPYSKICPICNMEMEFDGNDDCDTELGEKVKKEEEAYKQTEEYKEWYSKNGNKPKVECPYCHSTNTRQLEQFEQYVRTGLYSHAKRGEWHCNYCGSDF